MHYISPIGLVVKQLRDELGITQDDLSDKAGIAYSTLAKLEHGGIKSPTFKTISALAKALGVSVDDLLKNTAPAKIRPRFVYCDLNGVLVDHWQSMFERFNQLYGVSKKEIADTFWFYNHPVNRGEMTTGEFETILQRKFSLHEKPNWTDIYLHSVKPVRAMHDAIKEIAKEYQVGLLTNTFPNLIGPMKKAGLIPKIDFAAVIDSSLVKAIKPDPKIYKIAAEQAGVKKTEILFLDDLQNNIAAAIQQGWQGIVIDRNDYPKSAKQVLDYLKLRS